MLRVELPVTGNALKTAFRRRASEEHPDHSKHPRAADRFREVQTAFEALDGSEHVVGAPPEAKCDDGTPLSECGLGLGPTVNGKACPACHGCGYREIRERKPCPDCRTWGVWSLRWAYRCRKCGGSGRFLRNGHDVGKCYPCDGRGWIRADAIFNNCRTCDGTRYATTQNVTSYVRCSNCEGTGEVKVLNPVLPKGLLGGLGGER